MAEGKLVKETFRLGAKDHMVLMEKVNEAGIKKSEYIRQVLLRDIYNRSMDGNVMEQVCRLSTKCTLILEECEITDKQRLLLTKEGKKLWKEL